MGKTEKARDWGKREKTSQVLLDAKGLKGNKVTGRNGDAIVILQRPSAEWFPGRGRTSKEPWKSSLGKKRELSSPARPR